MIKSRTYLPRIVGDKVMMPADLKRLHKYVIGDEALELLAGVLGPAIGMMQQRIGLAPVSRSPSPGVTSYAVIVALIDQPTTRREKRSTTAAT